MRHALRLSLQMPDGRHRAQLPRHRVARWVGLAAQGPAEIAVRIVGEPEARRLNHDYRGKDYATNVLTFDYAREPVLAADIVLCAQVVEREAAQSGVPVADHYAHLVLHGVLHARGFDHERAADARRMERLEAELLGRLGIADPYRQREEPR